MNESAPYRRIVAEIRARIDGGDLRPGERVPSTRQIVREWGVAMATATRVITVLRDEGLVDTRPGAGTVVRERSGGPAPAASRRARREPDVDQERVVRVAVTVADAEGLAALTMRRLATELGVATMSLYRHVVGRDALTLLMVDAVLAEEQFPPERAPNGWRARLEAAARSMWTVFRRHPWAAEAMSMTRPQVMPSLFRYAEWTLGTLREMGLTPNDMMRTHIVFFGYVRSTALSLQAEDQALRDTGLTNDEWMDSQGEHMHRAISTGQYPTMRFVLSQPFDFDLDTLFEFGLSRLLDGVAAALPHPA
ncbi:TetR/AcrR family transcriptional regulator C-terminal domain-containing protein [Micromonospora zhanjiangensis]